MNATIRHLIAAESATMAWALRLQNIDPNIFTAFLAEFKQAIPHRDRKWVPATREWFLRADVISAVESLLMAHSIAIKIETGHHTAPPHRMDRAQALAAMYLRADAPDYLIPAVYRAMAKKLHPDAGGSTEQMQRLNAALEVLK